MKQTCILVLGMHRSGTSALTGVLQYLDIDLGSNLAGAAQDNKKGFFENELIVEFNDNLLKSIDSSWDDAFYYYFKHNDFLDTSTNIEKLKEIILNEFSQSDIFAIKDPRLCYLFPIYAKVLKELKVKIKIIIPYRNPFEVAKSLEKRNNFSLQQGLLLWLNYFLHADLLSREFPRYFISFDKLLQNTNDSIEELDKYLETNLYQYFLSNKDVIVDFLEKGLKHNISSEIEQNSEFKFFIKYITFLKKYDLNIVEDKIFDELRSEFNTMQSFYYGYFHSVIHTLKKKEENYLQNIQDLHKNIQDLHKNIQDLHKNIQDVSEHILVQKEEVEKRDTNVLQINHLLEKKQNELMELSDWATSIKGQLDNNSKELESIRSNVWFRVLKKLGLI